MALVIDADRYAMIGMPTPYVAPSFSYNRTCTGLPLGAGDTEGDAPPAGCWPDDGAPDHAARGVESPPHAVNPRPTPTSSATTRTR
ncbi:hypothetical protein Dsi01nite_069150 [Dactylosporangium siamense]|uniref:Uncharacterized protein n=1 Tax=Dactylosporangium siamense TaxID=685454 RepID=A0A919PRP5_9ACTN|nr:hypothetical protein Dsi01nite_069150 [Dactylosporangium siamense]